MLTWSMGQCTFLVEQWTIMLGAVNSTGFRYGLPQNEKWFFTWKYVAWGDSHTDTDGVCFVHVIYHTSCQDLLGWYSFKVSQKVSCLLSGNYWFPHQGHFLILQKKSELQSDSDAPDWQSVYICMCGSQRPLLLLLLSIIVVVWIWVTVCLVSSLQYLIH